MMKSMRRLIGQAASALLPALFLFSPAALAQGAAGAQRIEWIDVHVHLVGGPPQKSDFPGAVGAALAAMDEAGIRASVIMPPPQTSEMRALHDVEDYVQALKRYPGRFAFLGGGGTLNVMLQQQNDRHDIDASTRASFERTARDILAAGAAGFGEMTAHHISMMRGHPYEWVSPDHPLLLLLADIAAGHDALIDLHLDLVPQDMGVPSRFQSGENPPVLKANFAAFERLLAHNRKAKIVWAHAGSDPLGHWTPGLSRELLARHPNLYMSLRFPARFGMAGAGREQASKEAGAPGMPGGGFGLPAMAFQPGGTINAQWLQLVQDFPDRFVLGGDQFVPSPSLTGEGPGLTFAKLSSAQRDMARRFLNALRPDVARKVAMDNARRLYKLVR